MPYVTLRIVSNPVEVRRLLDKPIIDPFTHSSIGHNIQGPSLIRVPDWLPNPLGRYYLYFADHQGTYIRLAVADDILGPWRVHVPGSLQLADSGFPTEPPIVDDVQIAAVRQRIAASGIKLSFDPIPDMLIPHIASPDVHVDHERKEIVLYFHGLERFNVQITRVATSADGISFAPLQESVRHPYLRAFRHLDMTYALTMPGHFYRSVDGRTGWERGPTLFEPNMRHCAVLLKGNTLSVFWTRVEDVPEAIMLSTIDLSGEWDTWHQIDHGVVLRPEHDWEGANEPLEASERGQSVGVVNQLRDPFIFVDGNKTYLLYSVGGESGIAIAEVTGLEGDA
jgi:hypothetical protein